MCLTQRQVVTLIVICMYVSGGNRFFAIASLIIIIDQVNVDVSLSCCIYIYMVALTYTGTYAITHERAYSGKHAGRQARTHVRTDTDTHRYAQTHSLTYSLTHSLTHTRTHTHAHTDTHKHTHTHKHTNTYTHTRTHGGQNKMTFSTIIQIFTKNHCACVFLNKSSSSNGSITILLFAFKKPFVL